MKSLDSEFSATSLEPLEARIAPAATVTYTDWDGDIVKITASTGPLDEADLSFIGGGTSGQLDTLTLLDPEFAGAKITFSVKKADGGDGQADVDFIDAAGVDLASVSVKGDLGRIDVGDGNDDVEALGSLSALSMGLSTGMHGLESTISGSLGALKISGIMATVHVRVAGDIGSVSIKSLIGGFDADSGSIQADGAINSVSVKGSLVGGDGANSGSILAGTSIGKASVSGNLSGGGGRKQWRHRQQWRDRLSEHRRRYRRRLGAK